MGADKDHTTVKLERSPCMPAMKVRADARQDAETRPANLAQRLIDGRPPPLTGDVVNRLERLGRTHGQTVISFKVVSGKQIP